MKRILVAAVMSLAWLSSAPAQETWPARPVRFVVGSAPGGATDTFARLIAQRLTETLGQPFFVENRPGASGNIGAAVVANAAPDGYTFLISSSQALIINPSLFTNLPYNAERDFAPVARGVISPLVFIVDAAFPAKTLADLVHAGKSEPGAVTYGSAGAGSTTYLGVRMLEEVSGAKFFNIPYAGVTQAMQGLLT